MERGNEAQLRPGLLVTPQRLREIRKGLGLTQAEFASRMGLSRDYIGQMERGVAEINFRTASACEALANGRDEITTLRIALLRAAPYHSDASSVSRSISLALGVSAPVTMDKLIACAINFGIDPDDVWTADMASTIRHDRAFDIDREISEIIGRSVRGTEVPADAVRLDDLSRQRSSKMMGR